MISKMELNSKDLLEIKELSGDEINYILDTAESFKEVTGRDIKKVPTLRGKTVINAGDGAHEHPTQALLDMFTIKEKKGRIEGLKIAIIGDIAHSRVARSNIYGLTKLGAEVRL